MAGTTPDDRDGRSSVVPLSLALMVFNVLGGHEPPPAPAAEPRSPFGGRAEDPAGPASAPAPVCC